MVNGSIAPRETVRQTFGAALDVFTVRKLGVPGHEEFAMGAPGRLSGVGSWYEDFSQVSDSEVRLLLNRAALRGAS